LRKLILGWVFDKDSLSSWFFDEDSSSGFFLLMRTRCPVGGRLKVSLQWRRAMVRISQQWRRAIVPRSYHSGVTGLLVRKEMGMKGKWVDSEAIRASDQNALCLQKSIALQ
jgi:hypothetical protein